jgi:hypothetical protein
MKRAAPAPRAPPWAHFTLAFGMRRAIFTQGGYYEKNSLNLKILFYNFNNNNYSYFIL